eukprot:9420036-Pyramimonas_sp.AAC.1
MTGDALLSSRAPQVDHRDATTPSEDQCTRGGGDNRGQKQDATVAHTFRACQCLSAWDPFERP